MAHCIVWGVGVYSSNRTVRCGAAKNKWMGGWVDGWMKVEVEVEGERGTQIKQKHTHIIHLIRTEHIFTVRCTLTCIQEYIYLLFFQYTIWMTLELPNTLIEENKT